MTYKHNPKVDSDVARRSRQDIDNVNKYMDGFRGTVIAVETIQHGQSRPYADSVYEARIFCYSPNAYTTNAPGMRCIDEVTARQIAKAFVRDWPEEEGFLSTRLEFIRPEPNPCGMEENPFPKWRGEPISSCWHVKIVQPYCD